MDGDDVSDGDRVSDGDCVSDGAAVVDGDGDRDGDPGLESISLLLQEVVSIPGTSHPMQQVLGNENPSCASYHEHWLSGAANCTERQSVHDVCVVQSAASPWLFSTSVQISDTLVTFRNEVRSKHGTSAMIEHDTKHLFPLTQPQPAFKQVSQVEAAVPQSTVVDPGDTVGFDSICWDILQTSAAFEIPGNVVLS